MADLRTEFCGIKSPNPFWLASAPPTDKEYNVVRAYKAGWGGVVWKTLGEDPPIVNVAGPRYGAIHSGDRRLIGLNNIELITDRALQPNLDEIKRVKRDWPDRALVVSLMVPCEEPNWTAILRHVEDTGADGVELNFGCPHGMSERGMGSAVGQVPEYIEMVARWCKAATRMPVIVKLTPNITDIRYPARAAKKGGADAVSLVNTINSITNVNLDIFAPEPTIDGKGSHGGYCGPAIKPIALSMVSEIARDPETRGYPDLRHRRHHHLARRGRVHGARRQHRAGVHGGDDLRLPHRRGDEGRAVALSRREGPEPLRSRRPRRAQPQRLAVPQPQLRHQGAHRPGPLHQMRPLPHRLRGHLAPGDHGDQERRALFRGDGRRVRRLQSLRQCLPGRGLHHHGAAHRHRPAERRAGKRLPQLDGAPQQPDGQGRRRGRRCPSRPSEGTHAGSPSPFLRAHF